MMCARASGTRTPQLQRGEKTNLCVESGAVGLFDRAERMADRVYVDPESVVRFDVPRAEREQLRVSHIEI